MCISKGTHDDAAQRVRVWPSSQGFRRAPYLPDYTSNPPPIVLTTPELLARINVPDDPLILDGHRDNLGNVAIWVRRKAIDGSGVTCEREKLGQG